jgi:hypothetical protein
VPTAARDADGNRPATRGTGSETTSSRRESAAAARTIRAGDAVTAAPPARETSPGNGRPAQAGSREEKKRIEAEERRQRRALEALQARIATVEARIADRERQMKELEGQMTAPGFYENHETSKPVLDRHQALMWEIGDLMHQWEELAAQAENAPGPGGPKPKA